MLNPISVVGSGTTSSQLGVFFGRRREGSPRRQDRRPESSAWLVPPPVMRSRPARMPSTLSEFRAKASANVSILVMALLSASEFSASTSSTRWKASRAAWVQSCPACGAASRVGGAPPSPVVSGEVELPPRNATAAPPVSPWVSMLTCVSARIGVPLTTAIVAITSWGASALSPSPVTSPTRMPLNKTVEPISRPETEP